MPSTYTTNLGIELPADGELDGVWGDVVNENMDILDRAINGSVALTLSGTTSTLTTSDGALSDGQYKLLVLGGTPSGTHTITIAPNDAQKIYFVRNTTAQSVVFTQGSGGNVTIATGDSAIIYSDGAGAGAAVVNITNDFAMSSVKITGGTIDGTTIGGSSPAVGTFTTANATTVDTTNIEVTTLKAKDGTSAGSVADSTGVVTLASSVLTTTDINGGTIDGAVIGGSSAAAGTFTTVTASGDVTIADKIVHSGDTNTAIRFPAADTVTVETSGAERLRVTSAGDVGIGVASPARKLDVAGGIELSSASDQKLAWGVSGSYLNWIESGGGPGTTFMRFATGNAEAMRINASGNVGIGQIPNASQGKLQINQPLGSTIDGALRLTDNATTSFVFNNVSSGLSALWSSGVLAFGTGNATFTERMRIDSSGNVGIGITSPVFRLDVRSGATETAANFLSTATTAYAPTAYNGLSARLLLQGGGATSAFTGTQFTQGGSCEAFFGVVQNSLGTADFVFQGYNGSAYAERMRLDASGNLGLKTTPNAWVAGAACLQAGNYAAFGQGRGGTADLIVSWNAVVTSGSNGGTGYVYRNTGDLASSYEQNGTHRWYIAPSGTAGNAISFTEAARIDSSGNLLVGKTTDNVDTVGQVIRPGAYASFTTNGIVLYVTRTASDGDLIVFRQAGVDEGTITVSGTTVSYNGGHLSRWAQFPDNSRPELFKGTVMSNLDQMSQWGDEDNEQLNCVHVSTVEGDANVAGVFVAWDSTDDGYNDILLGMTGDMVIRIGAGVTVARGDLLMSAGDGTAKPQGDDIVRSKTIAKVTSTHVSHTYADGSYAVPCVLMAC